MRRRAVELQKWAAGAKDILEAWDRGRWKGGWGVGAFRGARALQRRVAHPVRPWSCVCRATGVPLLAAAHERCDCEEKSPAAEPRKDG